MSCKNGVCAIKTKEYIIILDIHFIFIIQKLFEFSQRRET